MGLTDHWARVTETPQEHRVPLSRRVRPGRLASAENKNMIFFRRKYFVSSAGHRGGENLDISEALMFCF